MQKLLLYFNTLRHLQWIQIRYQLVFRLRQALFSIKHYNQFAARDVHPVQQRYPACVVAEGLYSEENIFRFLNLEKSFANTVDWNYNGFGKLWNYNLQYFDYLNDVAISDETSYRLVKSFSQALLAKKIQPEPFPVSLRLLNWIALYSRTGYNDPDFIKAMLLQIGYLEKNIEHHLQANHLLENYFTLSICGFFLRDDKMTAKYLASVKRELDKQLQDDGGHIEGSPMYHCLLLSKLLLLIDILDSQAYNPKPIQVLKQKATAMLSWLDAFCNNTGAYAMLNDAAPGIAAPPSILFERANLLGIYWQAAALKGSGYRKINAGRLSITIDVANIMPAYQPGHAHSDMLHFALELDGEPVLAEAGTSTYENNERRAYERSTAAHNTVVINNTDQSQVWSSFRVAKRAKLNLLEDTLQVVRASHDGYSAQGVIHTRRFSVNGNRILIMDELNVKDGAGVDAVAYFHLAPSLAVSGVDNGTVLLSNGIRLQFGSIEKIENVASQVADGFNRLVDTEKIIVHFSKKLQTQISIA